MKRDFYNCTSCTSQINGFNYLPFVSGMNEGMCLVEEEGNFRFLGTINNLTALSYVFLSSFTFNDTVTIDTKGWSLNLLYSGHVIDFNRFSSNSIVFNFVNFDMDHKGIIVRTRVYTTC